MWQATFWRRSPRGFGRGSSKIDAAAVVYEFPRDAEGRAAISDAVVERVIGPGLMQAGQVPGVIRAIHCDVPDFELVERRHRSLKSFLAPASRMLNLAEKVVCVPEPFQPATALP